MTEQATTEKTAFSWLTTEIALYGAIVCLALALRLGGLDIRVMDVPEADQAWQSWQLARGGVPEGSYSPLLLSIQALSFALFGATDIIARLLPALVGSAMVVLPYWMRAHLGRFGSLAAALSIAVSPTLVYSARYGDGVTLLIACALGAGALWMAYRRDRHQAYLYAIAVLGALALLADPRVIGLAIALIIAWAIERYIWKRNLGLGTEHAVPWKTLGPIAGVTLVLVATALSFNPSGLAAWADFPSIWAARLVPVVNGQPWYYALGALLLYEPFLLVFGALGAVDLIIRRDKAAILIWMALVALVLALLAGGRDAGDVALICALLALLIGRAIDNLVVNWQSDARISREGLYVLVGLGIMAYVGIESSFYARATYLSLEEAPQFLWFLLLAVLLIAILVGLLAVWYGRAVAWRSGGAVVALVLLACAFSTTTSLNFEHANDPRELHVLVASDEGTRDALASLADLSDHMRGHPWAAPVTVEARLGPVWLWYLRDREDVRVVEQLTSSVDTPFVLALAGEHPVLGEQYIGQDFVTRTFWRPRELLDTDRVSWWLYRKSAVDPEPVQEVILWMQAE